MSDTFDATAQLVWLRGQTEIHGGLHEAQVKQLQLWALMVGSSEASFDFDPDKKHLNYSLVLDKKLKRVPDRMSMLAQNAKWLLGSSWKINIQTDEGWDRAVEGYATAKKKKIQKTA